MRNDAPMLPELSSDLADRISLDAHLVERLAGAFRDQGWEVIAQGDRRADLVVARGKNRYVVEIKAAREPRKPEMQGALASAILQSKALAKSIGGKPLAILAAPSISDGMAESLREYVGQFGDGCPYGLIDLRGRLELHGPGLSGISAESDSKGISGFQKPVRPSVDLFSDLGQWLLKVLLAPRLPEKYLSAPRLGLRNAKHLAEVARVSVPHAARQVAQLRSAGFLDDDSLRLVRVGELLDQWRAANRRLALDVACRWLFPPKDSPKHLKEVLRNWSRAHLAPQLLPGPPVWMPGSRRAGLALFAALDALDLGFVSGAPLHIFAEDVSPRALEELGLVAALGERVDVFVRQPKYSESVFRGAVWRDGVAGSDVLQCWLDVADHPVRGQEQADQIWKRIIKPHLLEK